MSERELVSELLKYGVPDTAIFHDLYVRKYNGDFSQIDLVVLSPVGIIVFEVKEYGGLIWGNGNHDQWTQVLANGKKRYPFYNPIMQNGRHIEELKKKLRQFKDIPFYSVVVFYGSCEFRNINFVPNGTFIVKSSRVWDCMNVILSKEPVGYSKKFEIIRELRQAVRNGENMEIRTQHIRSVRYMLGKDRILD